MIITHDSNPRDWHWLREEYRRVFWNALYPNYNGLDDDSFERAKKYAKGVALEVLLMKFGIDIPPNLGNSEWVKYEEYTNFEVVDMNKFILEKLSRDDYR